MAGLLQDLKDPDGALRLANRLLSATGMLHVNVANAGSLHRRLAMAMGMISAVTDLSDRNRKFAQSHVYNSATLRDAVEKAGFSIEDEGGYFIKPFTHQQMASIQNVLTPQVISGLTTLGRELPEIASEIYVNARPS